MKHYKYILALFLAITILVISFYPCADRYVSSMVQTEVASTEAFETQHKEHSSDACSPFCTCVCCAVSVNLALPNYTLPQLLLTLATAKTLLPYPFVETVVYHIWQPPKLV